MRNKCCNSCCIPAPQIGTISSVASPVTNNCCNSRLPIQNLNHSRLYSTPLILSVNQQLQNYRPTFNQLNRFYIQRF